MIAAAGGHGHVWVCLSGAVAALDAAPASVRSSGSRARKRLVVGLVDRGPPADLRQRVTELIRAAAPARRSATS